VPSPADTVSLIVATRVLGLFVKPQPWQKNTTAERVADSVNTSSKHEETVSGRVKNVSEIVTTASPQESANRPSAPLSSLLCSLVSSLSLSSLDWKHEEISPQGGRRSRQPSQTTRITQPAISTRWRRRPLIIPFPISEQSQSKKGCLRRQERKESFGLLVMPW
jgi:hypothetical protein